LFKSEMCFIRFTVAMLRCIKLHFGAQARNTLIKFIKTSKAFKNKSGVFRNILDYSINPFFIRNEVTSRQCRQFKTKNFVM